VAKTENTIGYASPDHDRKFSLGRWTNTISGLGLVLFPPNINPIIVSNDHLTFVVIARHFPEQDCLFQDDNAPIHRANDVKTYNEENHINCLEWPAESPDPTFNSPMKLFSGPFHTLFPVKLFDPDFLLYNSPVVSFLIQGTLNWSFRHLNRNGFGCSCSL
jgi:hypothetical protein